MSKQLVSPFSSPDSVSTLSHLAGTSWLHRWYQCVFKEPQSCEWEEDCGSLLGDRDRAEIGKHSGNLMG